MFDIKKGTCMYHFDQFQSDWDYSEKPVTGKFMISHGSPNPGELDHANQRVADLSLPALNTEPVGLIVDALIAHFKETKSPPKTHETNGDGLRIGYQDSEHETLKTCLKMTL